MPLMDLDVEGRGLGGGAGDGDEGGDRRQWSSRRVRRVKANSKLLEFGANDIKSCSEGRGRRSVSCMRSQTGLPSISDSGEGVEDDWLERGPFIKNKQLESLFQLVQMN
jgi:hypothetical protein